MTDISDVTLAQNPFNDPLYQDNPELLFCGDEPTLLANEWMLAHATHLREQMADYRAYEEQFAKETLLNCGIIGGSFPVFSDFLHQLCEIHETYNRTNKTAYTGDMVLLIIWSDPDLMKSYVMAFPLIPYLKGTKTTEWIVGLDINNYK